MLVVWFRPALAKFFGNSSPPAIYQPNYNLYIYGILNYIQKILEIKDLFIYLFGDRVLTLLFYMRLWIEWRNCQNERSSPCPQKLLD